jgi:4-hydroxyproline epimerase
MKRIQVIDSHTGGEPTRIVIEGGPNLGSGPLDQRLARFRDDFDDLRRAVVNEPRGSDVLVGGLLCEPTDPNCTAGIIFFNNASYLGMCGHGTIGLMVTLKHLGKIEAGHHKIETPIGLVGADLDDSGYVSVQNVPSYRLLADVKIEVPNYGSVIGDVAWGGNWFFLVKNSQEKLQVKRASELTRITIAIRDTLADQGITGPNGELVDHIELFGPADQPENDSRNFVLCPGGAYDRSPCGTGTSAKLACLAADNKLNLGELWKQESIVGSVFACSYELAESDNTGVEKIVPTIRGQAHVSGETTLLLDPNDPFCMGIPS